MGSFIVQKACYIDQGVQWVTSGLRSFRGRYLDHLWHPPTNRGTWKVVRLVLCFGGSLRQVFHPLLKPAVDWIILYRLVSYLELNFCARIWCFIEGYTNFANK
jgi:hypothetical protein